MLGSGFDLQSSGSIDQLLYYFEILLLIFVRDNGLRIGDWLIFENGSALIFENLSFGGQYTMSASQYVDL